MLNIDFFNKISEIDKLFCNNIYKKYKSIDTKIELSYKKIDNIIYEYKIIIYNDDNIDVTIPIDNSNYKYKTTLYNIDDVYNYLVFHLKKYKI